MTIQRRLMTTVSAASLVYGLLIAAAAAAGVAPVLSVGEGGTGGRDAPSARVSLNVAERGANSTITSLTGITSITPSGGILTLPGELLLSNPNITSPTGNPALRSNYGSTAVYGATQPASFHQFSCVMSGQGATTPGIGTTCFNVSIRPDQLTPYSNYGRAGEWELYALTGAVVISAGFPLSGHSDLVAVSGGVTINDTTMANGTTGSHIYPVFGTANIGALGQAPVLNPFHEETSIATGGVVSYSNGFSALPNGAAPVVGIISQAGSFQTGYQYTIITAGTTDYVAIGAANNTPGTSFKATGGGSGTGTAVSTGYDSRTMIVPAGSFGLGNQYIITSVGTTNFVGIGASANTVGTVFTPTGVGAGTGNAVIFGWSAAYIVAAAGVTSAQGYRAVISLEDRLPHVGGLLPQPVSTSASLIAYDNQTPCAPTCPMTMAHGIYLPNVSFTFDYLKFQNFSVTSAGHIAAGLIYVNDQTPGATAPAAGYIAYTAVTTTDTSKCGSLTGAFGCLQVLRGIDANPKWIPIWDHI